MHHLFLNKSAKPDSGPLFSVPATGWAGIHIVFLLITPLTTFFAKIFAEPTSVKIHSLFKSFLIDKTIFL